MSDADRLAYRAGVIMVTASALIWSTAGLFTRIIAAETPVMLFWRGTAVAAEIQAGEL